MSTEPRLPGAPAAQDPELQQLLARANLEYGDPRDEAAAFRRLTLALERQSPERGLRPWLWVCAGVSAAALAVVLVRGPLQGFLQQDSLATLRPVAEPPVSIAARAETKREAASTAPSHLESPREASSERTRVQPALELPNTASQRRRNDVEVQRPRRLEAPARAASTHAVERKQVAEEAIPEEDCLALAREGRPGPAESCFEQRSRGAGLGAEMALYELARLRRDVLGDAEGALSALADYRRRFPEGSLRSEVEVSRVELLARSKRGPEALAASEQLLATPAGRERAAELRLLRGNVQRAAGSLREAIAEYERAEQLGGSLGEEATFLRAQCLEALGDSSAARQAYARAAQSAGPRRADAQERLEALQRAAP